MSDRSHSSLVDWILMAINPVLVMGMVGSLGHFLLDVAYRGQFADRLDWTLSWFVFAIVLITRIGIQIAPERAALYGLGLAGVTFLASQRFAPIDGPTGWLVSLVVIGVVWWSAHRLTYDTTVVDDRFKNVSPGLLDAARSAGKDSVHPPGLTVVWFSLAALPLFALGQSLIDGNDADRRFRALRWMAIYVGCGIGLLMTTSLLGLRCYLQARKLSIPIAMTARWLGWGTAIIAGCLVAAMVIPRPHPEFAWLKLPGGSAPASTANTDASPSDDAAEGKGAEKSRQSNDKSGGQAKAKTVQKDGKNGDDGKGTTGGQKDSPKIRSSPGESSESDNRQDSPASKPLESAAEFLRSLVWIVLAIAAIIVAVLVIFRNSDWAAVWWSKLLAMFQLGRKDRDVVEAVASTPPPRLPRPFAAFSDPFADGRATSMSIEQLVQYSYDALEAWAAEQNCPKAADETPLEFANRLGNERPRIESQSKRLAAMFARTAYSDQPLGDGCKPHLADIWKAMNS